MSKQPYHGIRVRFNLRITIRARNPEDAWRRATAAARLIQATAHRVDVTRLEFSGKGMTTEQRAAIRAASDIATATIDYDERTEYWRLHRSMGILTSRLEHLETKLDRDDDRPKPVREREERETWALRCALRVLDGTLRTHEPLQVRIPRQNVEGGPERAAGADGQTPRLSAGGGSVCPASRNLA